MRVARPVTLDPEQREALQLQSRARSLPARVVERARIVLRAADGENRDGLIRALSTDEQGGLPVRRVGRRTYLLLRTASRPLATKAFPDLSHELNLAEG